MLLLWGKKSTFQKDHLPVSCWESVRRSVMFDFLRPHGLYPARLLCPWDFPGRNCHSLLQGIFLTQGPNPGLPHCRQILCHLSHQGSPKCWVKGT